MTSIEKIIVAFSAIVLLTCAALSPYLPSNLQVFLDNFHWTFTSAAATALAWLGYRAALFTQKPYKKWFVFALGSYLIGQLCWNVQVYTHHNPSPAPADLFYLAMGPCFAIGFFQSAQSRLSKHKLFAFIIDALSFTTAILGFVLVLYLPSAGSVSTMELLILSAYPVSILGAASISLLVAAYLKPAFMWAWLLMSLGLFIEGSIWMQWNLNQLHGLNETNTFLNHLFSYAGVMLGVAAFGWVVRPSQSRHFQDYCQRAQRIIPLVALAIGISTIFLIVSRSAHLPATHLIATCSIVGILAFSVLRENVLLRESERLANAEKVIVQKEREHEYLMYNDPLTNLPNRWQMFHHVEQSVIDASNNGFAIGILFIDLHRFKYINDSFGHTIGDQFLMEIALRLKKIAPAQGSLGHMGSDKFMLIIEHRANKDYLLDIAKNVISTVGAPLSVNNHEFTPEISMGISLYPQDANNAQDLMRNANTALHKAKERGDGSYQFYTEALTTQAIQQLNLDVSLRKAIANQELYLELQPIFNLNAQGHELHALEALVRWKKADGEIIPPSEFIPYAEEVGLIFQIGEWVVDAACAALARINKGRTNPIEMAINISPKQFRKGNLHDMIATKIKAHGIDPYLITLEITESAIFDQQNEAVKSLQQLKDMGVRIALDDFGVGHSSLFKLKSLPIDELKIDRAFLENVPTSESDKEILRSIVRTAQVLNLTVVAEGVETQAQYAFLQQIACQKIQGYLLSKPLSTEDLMRFLKTSAPHHA